MIVVENCNSRYTAADEYVVVQSNKRAMGGDSEENGFLRMSALFD